MDISGTECSYIAVQLFPQSLCRTFHHSKLILCPHLTPMSHSSLPQPLGTTILLSLNLTILGLSCKWNHTILSFSIWLNSCNMFSRFIDVVTCSRISSLFKANIPLCVIKCYFKEEIYNNIQKNRVPRNKFNQRGERPVHWKLQAFLKKLKT